MVSDAEVDNDLTISGGTVDSSVIGGSTAAAGSFTTLSSTGLFTGTGGLLVNNSTSTILNLLTVNATSTQATTTSLYVLDVANFAASTTMVRLGLTGAFWSNSVATSSLAAGVNITTGCFSISGTCVGAGSANPTLTDSVPFDWCVAQTDSTSFAPGGAFDDFAGNKAAIHMLNATSSRVFCSVHIPKSYSSGPSVVWGGSATTSGRLILDVNSTTTVRQLNGNQGGPVACQYAGVTVESNASSTAAKRLDIVGNASYPINSTSTAISLTLTAGGDLCVIFDRYGADANDTLSDGFFFDYKPYFNFTRAVN